MPHPDTTTISIDIETYGACTHTADGRPLPVQNMMHPRKSIVVDGCAPSSLILSCAVTLVEGSSDSLHEARPGDTMVFLLHKTSHRKALRQWFSHAQTIIGMNLLFDLLYLLYEPDIAPHLSHQLLVDLSVINFLHSDVRPERSLKDIGTALRLYTYETTLKQGNRFPSPNSPDFQHYNACDSHNTVLAIIELARRIRRDFPTTDKLSPSCLSFYSDNIWSSLAMMQAGVPLHIPTLLATERTLQRSAAAASRILLSTYNLPVEGTGSQQPRYDHINNVFNTIDESGAPSRLLDLDSAKDHKLFQFTEKGRSTSFATLNRKFAEALLLETNQSHLRTLRRSLKVWDIQTDRQKLLSSFTYPLLRKARTRSKKKHPLRSTAIPHPTCPAIPHPDLSNLDAPPPKAFLSGAPRDPEINRDTYIAYPRIYITPSPYKDDDLDGGQRQSRPAFQDPAAQTFPPRIKIAERSRWTHGSIIAFDLSQIELRVAAICSSDDGMCVVYQQDGDIHTDMAVRLFGEDILDDPHFNSGERKEDPRQWAKQTNFLVNYRGGPSILQATILKLCGKILPWSQCTAIVKSFPHVRPGLWAYQDRIISLANKQGYIELPLTGQSRTFHRGTASHKPNEMVNFPIQTHAANIMWRIQHHVHTLIKETNLGDRILPYCNRYDALYLDVHPSCTTEAHLIIRSACYTVATADYFAHLCRLHNEYRVPLKYEFDDKDQPPQTIFADSQAPPS